MTEGSWLASELIKATWLLKSVHFNYHYQRQDTIMFIFVPPDGTIILYSKSKKQTADNVTLLASMWIFSTEGLGVLLKIKECMLSYCIILINF